MLEGMLANLRALRRKTVAAGGFFFALIVVNLILVVNPSCAQTLATQPAASQPVTSTDVRRAIEEIRVTPHVSAEYDYIMTARVRLLLFWAGQDDVGGGYIRRGLFADPSAEFFQIVMGSDPAKAPRAINRWGAAVERVRESGGGETPESSTFFGFMKVYKGKSVSEMQKELDGEKGGHAFLFSAILNQADRNESVAKSVPFATDTDFNIHQLDQAEPVVFDKLEDTKGTVRSLAPGEFRSCGRPEGFLSSVSELVDDALAGHKTPESLCYVYNGQLYRLTLNRVTPVERETVKLSLNKTPQPYVREYQNLLRARIENFNETTHQGSSFELVLGTTGTLRGVPVKIDYQPNWWFQVELNLKTPEQSDVAGLR
jgi:hypothetical protein